jgi:hypothetical protein
MAELKKNRFAASAVAHYRRTLLLAPKSAGAYRQLRSWYAKMDDPKGLEALLTRLKKTDLDLSRQSRMMREQYAGKRDAEYRNTLKALLPRRQALVANIPRARAPLTFAVGASELAKLQLSADQFGIAVKEDDVLEMARAAHAAKPSAATTQLLKSVLISRVSRRLEARDPGLAELSGRCRRSLAANSLLPTVFARDPKTRAAALADPDFERALGLIRSQSQVLPSWDGPWDWKLFQSLGDKREADRLKAGIEKQTTRRLSLELGLLLNPMAASDALALAWWLEMEGRTDEGIRILDATAKRGVPLPDHK